jgi:RNA polymerase sigma factor (sigma-70 family)
MTRLRSPGRPAADDDRALLSRFAEHGDEGAFAALVARHGPLVLGVCRRVLRDEHRADDAFQAVFLVLARKAGRVRVGASLGSYLFGVARRVALGARRSDQRARNAERGARNEIQHSPDWDDLLRVLDEGMARLPDSLRAPVIECFFREKTQDEAAAALGWSLSTLRRRLEKAKALLRARLTRRGATLAAGLLAGAFAASTAMASVPPSLAQAAIGVATVGRAGGAVGTGLLALANGGSGMSLVAKVGVCTAAVVIAALVAASSLSWSRVQVPPAPPSRPADPPPASASREETKPAEPPRPAEQPKPSAPSSPAEDANWVTVRGRVVLPGGHARRPVDVTTDKEHCLSNGPLTYEDLVVNPKTFGVKNVVVWLRPDSENRRDAFPRDRIHPSLLTAKSAHHVIDQPCCQFVPRILAARAGDTLEFRNSAPVPHNVNYSSDAVSINPTLPPGKSLTLDNPLVAQATPIPFKCDIHPWMSGRLRIFDHPYFAVTDEDGHFEIKLAPAGRWRVVVWHENGFHKGREGALGLPVELKPGVELPEVRLELPK